MSLGSLSASIRRAPIIRTTRFLCNFAVQCRAKRLYTREKVGRLNTASAMWPIRQTSGQRNTVSQVNTSAHTIVLLRILDTGLPLLYETFTHVSAWIKLSGPVWWLRPVREISSGRDHSVQWIFLPGAKMYWIIVTLTVFVMISASRNGDNKTVIDQGKFWQILNIFFTNT